MGLSGVPRLQLLGAGPLVLYLLLLLAYPSFYALRLAFTDPSSGEGLSLANFHTLWGDSLFWWALLNNLLLPALGVVLELGVGLAMALLFHQQFAGRRVLRTIAILPFALPEIVFLTAMRYIFAPRGYANATLGSIGIAPVDWLQPGTVLSFVTVVLVDAWHVTPVVFLILLAALSALPAQILEAAELDGASGWRRVRYIIVPLLRPALMAALMLRGLDALRVFATPMVLTGVEGVPVLSSYAYHQWSDYGSDHVAAAAAVILALLCVGLIAPLALRHKPA